MARYERCRASMHAIACENTYAKYYILCEIPLLVCRVFWGTWTREQRRSLLRAAARACLASLFCAAGSVDRC